MACKGFQMQGGTTSGHLVRHGFIADRKREMQRLCCLCADLMLYERLLVNCSHTGRRTTVQDHLLRVEQLLRCFH